MPFYDYLKNLFNIPPRTPRNEGLNDGQNLNDNRQNENYNFWGPNADQYEEMWRDAHNNAPNGQDNTNIRNFNVFTDPLEMHRYFEQQMNEMLKSFGGFFGANNGAGFFGPDNDGTFSYTEITPAIEEPPQNRNLRDRFLKPGYENKTDYSSKRDHVLDDRAINPNDLDTLLNKEKQPQQEGVITPYQHQPLMPKIRSFGQSMSSKTIRRPDGSLEIHKTIRDSAGNEENVVTRQIGDKQYTITVRTDKEGRQEKCEDLVNMDEKELAKFKDYWNRTNKNNEAQVLPQNDDLNINRLFPYFDKFFK